MTQPTPIINPLTLSPEARQANEEREQHEAQAEGLLYIEQEYEGTVSQYWVKYQPGRPIEDYTGEDFHRPGNRPALIEHNPSSTIFEYWVDGAKEGARTDGGPTLHSINARGQVGYQKWPGPRADGGPVEIYTLDDGTPKTIWQGTPKPTGKLASTKAEAKESLGNIEEHELTAHQRLRWEVLKSKQGGVFWRPDTESTEIHRPGGVKAAAAAAQPTPTAERPKTPRRAVQGDAR